ncbi:SDR family oxidoreductase [Hansschlegelia sp.]|uniref:SDR family oxidoreductase n=1 Tax=Hansschlegelia sp. TaxID=2041892 RepID=UPI002CCA69D3|nr:SDR family oxidoreductase [Hansschlegelia sp.]HVI28255.1 SDR family oxidoreductase [Hansschlegelia sp.]
MRPHVTSSTNVLVIGGSGLIGSEVVARLIAEGAGVVALARRIDDAARRVPQVRWVWADIASMKSPADWFPHLVGVDAVVNCAGVLQDAPGDDVRSVFVDAVAALTAACGDAGVRRIVHISAIGVDRGSESDFSAAKLEGDRALMGSPLDWVILRPSVVLGRRAYGGSALIRGLAALPFLPVMPGTGLLQVVQLDDLVDTILFFLSPGAPNQVAIEIAGPEPMPLPSIVQAYRRWLGLPRARVMPLPEALASFLYRLGDLISRLGWRPPMRTTAQREIVRGAVGDPGEWIRLTGTQPRSVSESLVAEPASVQERWFASLYFLKPVVFGVFSLFWIATGLISIGPGYDTGVALMERGGAGAFSGPSVLAGGLADLLIGIGIAFRRTARAALYGAIAISLFYAVAGTAILPELWLDPLGPMLKIWPILALNLVALALLPDR